MARGAQFLSDARGSIVVYVGTDAVPDDESWELYVSSIEARADEQGELRIIGFVGAGAPTPVQRQRLMRRLPKLRHRVSIVSRSLTARSIVTVLHWLGAKIRAFSPASVAEALAYLELDDEERRWVLDAERRLRERLTG